MGRRADAPEAGEPELSCRRCNKLWPVSELDRQLWCEACRAAAGRSAALWGRLAGFTGAVVLALWIAWTVGPSGPFLIGWGAVVLVFYRLLGRLARELAYGIIRARQERASPTG